MKIALSQYLTFNFTIKIASSQYFKIKSIEYLEKTGTL